jgi:N-acetylmuramoyl-L-alanine amidase
MLKMKSNTIALSLYLLLSMLFTRATALATDQTEEQFNETVNLYKNLTTDPEKVKNPEIWDLLARAFYRIYLDNPESAIAPNSLFFSGKMYEEIGNRFGSREDLEKSVDRSTLFIRAYPKSELADDAQIRKARIVEKWDKKQAYLEYERVTEDFPDGDMVHAANEKLKDLSPFKPSKREKALANKEKNDGLVKIKEIRHWSTGTKTRVVIHLDKEMPYKSYFLKPDPDHGKPPRLLVDILGTTVDKDLPVAPVDKGLLEKIKFGRNTPDKARVVLYIKSFEDYRVFSLNDPFRIVMDIDGSGSNTDQLVAKDEDSRDDQTVASLPRGSEDISTLRGALGLKVKTIVIDPGHGGHDTGALGPTGLKEKDVNLKN